MQQLKIEEVYSHAYDYRTRTILMARASLGGKQHDEIVKSAINNIRIQAIEAIEVSRLYRELDLPLPWRKATENLRREAILICGMTRKQMTADGTLPFLPIRRRMNYNVSILKHYERMLDSLTCLRDIAPLECPQ